MTARQPPTPYRPGSGTDGERFTEAWCSRCTRDPMSRNEDARTGCPILARAFAFDVGDREYPKQLVEDEDGPRCTAFRPLGQRRHRRTRPVPGQLTLEQP